MKKIILVCFLFLMAQVWVKPLAFNKAYADEIIDSKGNIIPCKIETVEDGLIEYHKNGSLHTFAREQNSNIFNDYVDVRLNLLEEDSVTRFSGKVIVKDMWSTVLRNENGDMDIPWYKVKFIGVYKP